MVFFSCDGCGDMLKKAQVDGHAQRCHRCQSVSCVDCNVSFYGDDYRAHTSCITEVERYEKRVPIKKNGKVAPQQLWMDLIAASIDDAPAHLQSYVRTMSGLDNAPRKEKQFRNFAMNSLGLPRNQADKIVGEIWAYLKARREQEQQAAAETKKKDKEASETTKTGESRKVPSVTTPDREDSNDETASTAKEDKEILASSELSKKSVKKAMKKVLKKAKGQSLTIKALRKAVESHLTASSSSEKGKLKKLVEENVHGGGKKPTFVLHGKEVKLR